MWERDKSAADLARTLKTLHYQYGAYIKDETIISISLWMIVYNHWMYQNWKSCEKGEIAHNEHFLFFPKWFEKFYVTEASKCVCKLERIMRNLKHYFDTLRKHCGKSKIANKSKFSFLAHLSRSDRPLSALW